MKTQQASTSASSLARGAHSLSRRGVNNSNVQLHNAVPTGAD